MTHENTILVYDVETTGLPLWSEPSEHPDQPRVIQIAASLIDVDTRTTQESLDFIIKPNGWIIPDDIAEMTSISNERAIAEGVEIHVALPLFLSLWERATVGRVGHNESFDARMVRIEMMKAGIYDEAALEAWKTAASFDTCLQSTKIVNLPPTAAMLAKNRKGPKQPKLEEAYKFFTGLDLEGGHDAGVDVMACKAVYFAIQDYNATTKAA